MNGERWHRVRYCWRSDCRCCGALSFLDRASCGDSELRSEVASLLSSHEQAGTGF